MRPCDREYLQALINSILSLRRKCVVKGNWRRGGRKLKLFNKRARKSLAAIGYEIDRLDKHPELFPSETMRHKFFGFVYKIFRKWNKRFDEIKASKKLRDDGMKRYHEWKRQQYRCAYTANRNPWQQYLHNKAPGSGYNPGGMKREGSTQILPMGAARLFDSHVREYKEAREQIEAVSALPGICALTEKTII